MCSGVPAATLHLYLTNTPTTFDLSLSLCFISRKKKEKKASKDREAPATKHKNERHKHQRRYTLLNNMCTQNTWSWVQKHAHRQTHVRAHTHTQSYQPVKSCEATAVCLFVCVAVSGVFVIQHDRARSLWGPLIPLVEMKCNGADSIRALPPREKKTKRRESNHTKSLRAFPAFTAAF